MCPTLSAQFFEQALEALPVTAYVFDLTEKRTLYANRRWVEGFGYTLAETQAVGDFLTSILHPQDRQTVLDHHAQIRASLDEANWSVEYRVRHKSGQWCWLSSQDRVFVRDGAGYPTQIIGVAHDVTRQRSAAAAAAESDSLFRAIVEHHPDAVFIAEDGGRLVQVNAAACAQLGYERDELLGLNIEAIVAPEFHRRAHGRFAERPSSSYVESVHIRKDGTRVPVETVVVPIWVHGKHAALGVARDITERKAAERDYRHESELRHAIIENAVEGICVCEAINTEPGIEFSLWNRRMAEITGYSIEEINRLGWYQTMYADKETEQRALERMTRMRQGEDLEAEQWTITRKDGTERTLFISTRLLLDTLGQPKVLGVMHDITERVRLEAQLHQAQRLEAIGRLAGAVAHDFNNVLTSTLGAGALLAEVESLTEGERQLALDIVAASEHGGTLTHQLLTFAKRQRTEFKTFDWATQVQGILRVVRRLLSNLIRVELNLQQGCFVQGDTAMLDQVIVNLCVNARDAMPNGGTLQLTLAPSSDADGEPCGAESARVKLCVSDTGRGIASEVLPHIFDPFFTTKDLGKGTGLGLATVHSIVAQHHGTVAVSSNLGEGTAFTVLLPLVAPVVDLPEQASSNDQMPPLTVLLVEDNASVRGVIRQMLESMGHRVLLAVSGEEVRSYFGAQLQGISLVLSDVALGSGINGVELAAEIRQVQPLIPVVLMSGFDPSLSVLPEGVPFIRKPFAKNELDRVLQQCKPEYAPEVRE